MGTVSRGARARRSMGRSVPRHPGIARCGDATNQAHVAGPDQRPSGSGWDLGQLFRPRLSPGLPVAPVLRGSEPRCLSGPDRPWVDTAAALKLTGLPPPNLVCWTGATAMWLPHCVPKPLHQALQQTAAALLVLCGFKPLAWPPLPSCIASQAGRHGNGKVYMSIFTLIGGVLLNVVIFGGLLFVPAGTLDWWRAGCFWGWCSVARWR